MSTLQPITVDSIDQAEVTGAEERSPYTERVGEGVLQKEMGVLLVKEWVLGKQNLISTTRIQSTPSRSSSGSMRLPSIASVAILHLTPSHFHTLVKINYFWFPLSPLDFCTCPLSNWILVPPILLFSTSSSSALRSYHIDYFLQEAGPDTPQLRFGALGGY